MAQKLNSHYISKKKNELKIHISNHFLRHRAFLRKNKMKKMAECLIVKNEQKEEIIIVFLGY